MSVYEYQWQCSDYKQLCGFGFSQSSFVKEMYIYICGYSLLDSHVAIRILCACQREKKKKKGRQENGDKNNNTATTYVNTAYEREVLMLQVEFLREQLFTNDSRQRLAPDILDIFCHRFRPASWRHWYRVLVTKWQHSQHTLNFAFRHLPPNSARIGYATEGTLFIYAQLSTDAVSTLWKLWVLIIKYCWSNIASK